MPGQSLIGNLAVLLSMNTGVFETGASRAQRLMAQTQRQFQQMGQRITRAGAALTIGVTAPFVALMRTAIPAAIESREALGQVEAAIASMGPAAGRTAAQLQQAASALQDISLFDDDDILRKVTSNLLTFGRVSGDVFDRAQLAIVNISARLGTDLQSATLMVGRALNDPIRGLAALRRTGIQFSADQERMIRRFVAQGNLMAAQGVMLTELERQFGGAAEAARRARPDAAMQQAWREFQETIGAIAIRVLPPLTDFLTRLLDRFNRLSPATQNFAVAAFAVAAALGPVMVTVGGLVSLLGTALPLLVRMSTALWGLTRATAAWGAVSAAVAGGGGWLATLGRLGIALRVVARLLGPLGIAAGAVYAAFQNWDQIRPYVERLGAALSELWNGPLGSVLRTVGGALLDLLEIFGRVFGTVAVALLRGFAEALTTAVTVVSDFVNTIAALLTGDWARAWESAKAMVSNFFGGFLRTIEAIIPGILGALRRIWEGVREYLVDRMNALRPSVEDAARGFAAPFEWLHRVVVGNSYVPDMVDEIGRQMRRLDAEMVAPARGATSAAAQAFRDLQGAVSGILNRLYPIQARENQLIRDVTALGKVAERERWPVERLADAMRRLKNEFHSDLVTDTPVVITALDSLPDQAERARGITEGLRRHNEEVMRGILDSFARIGEATRELGRDINQVIENGLRGMMRGFTSLKDVALEVIFAIGDAILTQILNRLNGAGGGGGIGGAIANLFASVLGSPGIGGGSFGPGSGGLGSFATSIAGARARGGPVSAGRTFLVGERGAELFTPNVAGRIHANDEIGGGRSVTIHQHFRFEGVAVTQQEFVHGLTMTKHATLDAVRNMDRRRAG